MRKTQFSVVHAGVKFYCAGTVSPSKIKENTSKVTSLANKLPTIVTHFRHCKTPMNKLAVVMYSQAVQLCSFSNKCAWILYKCYGQGDVQCLDTRRKIHNLAESEGFRHIELHEV